MKYPGVRSVLSQPAELHCLGGRDGDHENRLLLSSDEHLRGMDHRQLGLVLQEFDLSAPVIATASDVVKEFFQR